MLLKFKKIPSKNGKLIENPKYATEGSACFDLICNFDEEITIKPQEIVKVATGIAIEINSPQFVGLIYPRSGLATKSKISLANCVGVIDSDYRGQIFVPIINNSNEDFTIKPDERIAQLAIMPVLQPILVESKQLSETKRGENGFGSTGK